MPVALRLGPVLEVVARVQDLVVVQELHVAGRERHREMDRGIVRDLVHQVHRLELRLGEPPRLGKLRCADSMYWRT